MARRSSADQSSADQSPQKQTGRAKGPRRGKRRLRTAVSRKIMQVGVLRRWYIRRMLKFIDKSQAKGRALPQGLEETARFLSRVPKHQRAKAFEDAIQAQQEVPNLGREYRRAAERQRRSGTGYGYRPGMPPGTLKQQGKRRPR